MIDYTDILTTSAEPEASSMIEPFERLVIPSKLQLQTLLTIQLQLEQRISG